MSMPAEEPAEEPAEKVVPAQVGFLAIYNPSLGTSDETIHNQIVYYYSQGTCKKRGRNGAAEREQKNEQLRQIGFAQGMVDFGRNFSAGAAVDTVETEKSRILLHQLESGWWILASINLTILPKAAKAPSKEKPAGEPASVEYSSREVKPAVLLLGDLLRAHSTFLLHHASSISALFVRTQRVKFIALLTRYWDTHIATWNVLMHGNPANNLYGGIKIAGCGELGIGVGEEGRGSGEREVLEGFVPRIDGLVEVIVSKFGDEECLSEGGDPQQKQNNPWLGSGSEPEAADGAIFLGTGALSRKTLRDISHWVDDLYRWGPYAYGVIVNPTSNRRAKKRKPRQAKEELAFEGDEDTSHAQEPPRRHQSKLGASLIDVQPAPIRENESHRKTMPRHERPPIKRGNTSYRSAGSESSKTNKLVSYLKLGYGTHWTLGRFSTTEESHTNNQADSPSERPSPSTRKETSTHISNISTADPVQNSTGHFLIGLMGGLKAPLDDVEAGHLNDSETLHPSDDDDTRVLLRTLTVEVEREKDARAEVDISIDLGEACDPFNPSQSKPPTSLLSEGTGTASNASYESQDRNKTKKLRVVVYASRPFIFVFLFELRTESLALGALYRDLHAQLERLVKPLVRSTRLSAERPAMNGATNDIYDLIYHPHLLTIHSNLPNIPTPLQSSPSALWTRKEALNTHMQILTTYTSCNGDASHIERTCKTSRGWWVVYTRTPCQATKTAGEEDDQSATANLSSGSVKVPQLITESSVEVVAAPYTEDDTGLGHDASTRNERGLASSKGRGSKGARSTSFRTSTFSGPAHPFRDAHAPSNKVARDQEIWLVRRGAGGMGFGRRMGEERSGEAKLVNGIGVDTRRYIEGLLGVR